MKDIQPILDRRCVSCHGGLGEPEGRLDLRGDRAAPWTVSYRSLHVLQEPGSGNHGRKRYVDERQALSSSSYLIEKLTGRELEAPQELDTPGVRHPKKDGLTPDELLTLIRWIDLGAAFLGAK